MSAASGGGARPEALFLAHRIPYPPDKGDKIRSWRLFQHLRKTHAVHLGAFVDDPADMVHRDFLRPLCASMKLQPLDPLLARMSSARGFLTGEPLSLPYYRNGAMARWVRSVRRRPLDVEVAFSSTMAQYLERGVAGRPRLIDMVDADSEKWRQYADKTSGPMAFIYRREGRRLADVERRICEGVDAAFLVTQEERAALIAATGAPADRVDWWANGVDTDYFDPRGDFEPLGEAADVVFTGAMDYWANEEAVRWFADEAWPRILERRPGARFAIVGARPGAAVKALSGRSGVRVAGRVADMRPWIAAARVAAAPLRIARGVQNKVLEAMAMSTPVVATAAAAEGVGAGRERGVIVADDAASIADRIIELLDDPAAAEAVGAAGRARAVAAFAWDARLRRFDDRLAAVRQEVDTASKR